MTQTLPPAYFDALYAENADPWGFTTSAYEARKYAATIAALPRPRYAAALEVGCSIGVLTAALAQRCDAIVALDVAHAAIEQARTRNEQHQHIHFATGEFPHRIPATVPETGFDLILLSEVLYYFDRSALAEAALATLALAAPHAEILLVHWLGPTPDYPLTGDEAAETFIHALRSDAVPVLQQRAEAYRLDLLQR